MANEQNYEKIRVVQRQHAERLARLEELAGLSPTVAIPAVAARPKELQRQQPRQQPADNRAVPASITVRRVSAPGVPMPPAAAAAPAPAPAPAPLTAGALIEKATGFSLADLSLLVKDAVGQAVSQALAPSSPPSVATAPTEPAKPAPPENELDWLSKEGEPVPSPVAVR